MENIYPDKNLDLTGTSLQGEMVVEYDILVKMFGRQNTKNDGYKVDAEWLLWTPFGVATIYNYKDGKNYLGKGGLPIKSITDWHIGGHNKNAAIIVKTAIEAFCAGYQS